MLEEQFVEVVNSIEGMRKLINELFNAKPDDFIRQCSIGYVQAQRFASRVQAYAEICLEGNNSKACLSSLTNLMDYWKGCHEESRRVIPLGSNEKQNPDALNAHAIEQLFIRLTTKLAKAKAIQSITYDQEYAKAIQSEDHSLKEEKGKSPASFFPVPK